MPLRKRREDEYIPIKCEGWNGKFAVPSKDDNQGGATRITTHQNQQHSDSRNFFNWNTEPTILPTVWDGKFASNGETHYKPEANRSNTSDFYGFSNEPTVLPTTWSGKFETDPNDVRILPERNRSDVREYTNTTFQPRN